MAFNAVLLLLFSVGNLARQIDAALASSPAAQGALWGIQIVDVNTGEVAYEANADRFFVPASNTKLFTTALALSRLGPDHRFQTVVVSTGRDLYLVGSGHPIPLAAVEELADQIAARGIRRIQGDVVGDDTAYPHSPYPEGWATDDAIWDYGAPVSALTLNDNVFSLIVTPEGGIQTQPPVVPYIIDNRSRGGAGGVLVIDRRPGDRQLRIWGRLETERKILLAVEDPALWAAQLLLDALARRGISVDGTARARHAFPNEPAPAPITGAELARHTSAALVDDLRHIHKVSQNLHAELALRAVAKIRRGRGAREDGIDELKLFLEEAGVTPAGYNLVDGSGLSRLNLVTPRTVVQLLRHMHASPYREIWMTLLPIAGRDGTLRNRFRDTAAEGRLKAKTGTLTHVAALSGYAGRYAFAILVNNYHAPDTEIRKVIDTIGTLLVE